MQPLGTNKKSSNLSEQKNHATSWDKKITKPLGTKSHAISGDNKSMQPLGIKKKIMQPLKTKKIMQPLGTKKSRNLTGKKKNHATSRENNKKITPSLGTIAPKLVHRAPNFSKWNQFCKNGQNGSK